MKKQERDQEQLMASTVQMGSLAQSMVNNAVKVISDLSNDRMVKTVMDQETKLDAKQLEIDKEAVRQLTVYSPVAGDLRLVLSVSRVAAELERMGDHAVNMCENLQLLRAKSHVNPIGPIKKMAEIVCVMVSDALAALSRADYETARTTIANDDLVDALNDQIVEELLSDEIVKRAVEEDASGIVGAMAQILIARSLERIADQATNISEEVVYMIKGHDIRHGA